MDEFSMYENLTISAPDATITCPYIFADIEGRRESVRKNSTTYTGTDSVWEESSEGIIYVYVNKDVRVTGQGATTEQIFSSGGNSWGGEEHEWGTVITSNIDLQFKKGWNALYYKDIEKTVYNYDEYYEGSVDTLTRKSTMYVGDSSDIKWVLQVRG